MRKMVGAAKRASVIHFAECKEEGSLDEDVNTEKGEPTKTMRGIQILRSQTDLRKTKGEGRQFLWGVKGAEKIRRGPCP